MVVISGMCHEQLLIDLLFVDSLIVVVVFLCYTVVSICVCRVH